MATTKKRSKAAKKPKKKRAVKRTKAKLSPEPTPGPVNEWMELRRSAIHGLGAFSRKEIPKGTRIIEYTGERINNAEADRRYVDEKMRDHHTFLFIQSNRTVVDAAYDGNEARFINHSCDPNCETFVERSRIWIDALKRIPAGVELTYDYQYDDDPKYTMDDLKFYACHCGAANCRGTIVNTKKKVL
jgi:SET domain-containing protein